MKSLSLSPVKIRSKIESDKLARFIRASRKGFQDVLDDPQGCLQILLNNQDKANYPRIRS